MSILEVNQVSKKIGNKSIVDDITFTIEEGEIVGFVGANGAGKTTTIRLLTGLIYPTRGSIRICGYDIKKDKKNALQDIAAIVENPSLYGYMTGKEHFNYIRQLRNISKSTMDKIIDTIDLSNDLDTKVRKYSLGMKQRLALGLALMTKPKLLILDEPLNGLDPTGIMQIRNVLVDCAKEQGMAIFISSHILSELDRICSRIIFIKEGKIVATNTLSKNEKIYSIFFEDIEHAYPILQQCKMISSITINNHNAILHIIDDKFYELIQYLSQHEVVFKDINILEHQIDDEYKKLCI